MQRSLRLSDAHVLSRRKTAAALHLCAAARPPPRHGFPQGSNTGNPVVRYASLFDAHLPLLRYEQQPGVGLAMRKYILMRRGLLKTPAQRKPGAALSPRARDDVEHLLSRVARHDDRARLPKL